MELIVVVVSLAVAINFDFAYICYRFVQEVMWIYGRMVKYFVLKYQSLSKIAPRQIV